MDIDYNHLQKMKEHVVVRLIFGLDEKSKL